MGLRFRPFFLPGARRIQRSPNGNSTRKGLRVACRRLVYWYVTFLPRKSPMFGFALAALWLFAGPSAHALAMLAPEPRGGALPLVYVAIGASDGVSVGADRPAEGWVQRVHAQMPAGTRLVNLSVSGSLTSEALSEQLPSALAARPDIVTVWLAANDLRAGVPLQAYTAQLDEMLGRLSATGAEVYVGNLPNLAALPGVPPEWRGTVYAEVQEWNRSIDTTAARHGAIVVDLFAGQDASVDPSTLSSDGFHPSSEGYRRIALNFWSAMSRAVALRTGVRS